jgi:diguanylate cyclase (GGDEF)-like protein
MPHPSETTPLRPSMEDCFLDLLAETLEGLEDNVRGAFLQRFFKSFTQIELNEDESLSAWGDILVRQREFSDALGRRVALKTALMDVMGASHFLRVPVLLEYEAYKKLQVNAATDPLTGLNNRRFFDETCDRELNRAKRYNHPLTLIMFDLHRFKEVNDQYGHMKGDIVLQLAAHNLRKTMRASDFAFRFGGDEFALILPQTTTEQASTLCRRVRNNFENEVSPLNMKVAVTLDFGLAVYPQDADTKEGLVQIADQRLYALKGETRAKNGTPAPTTPASGLAGTEQTPPSTTPTTPAAPPRSTVTPIRPIGVTETPVQMPGPSATTGAQTPSTTPMQPKAQSKEQKRRWERVSLKGTKSYAVVDGSERSASVIDLSYGGVALQFEHNGDLPSEFSAVLHVPILPPLRVSLRKSYTYPSEGGGVRMGCTFVA